MPYWDPNRYARQVNRYYAHMAQRSPRVRRRLNIIMLGIVLPVILLIIGSLVVFFSMYPDGVVR